MISIALMLAAPLWSNIALGQPKTEVVAPPFVDLNDQCRLKVDVGYREDRASKVKLNHIGKNKHACSDIVLASLKEKYGDPSVETKTIIGPPSRDNTFYTFNRDGIMVVMQSEEDWDFAVTYTGASAGESVASKL